MSNPPFLTVPEVADLLQRTPARCYQMARDGDLPVVRVGGRLVVPRAALEGWLEEKTQRALASTHEARHAVRERTA